MSNHEQSEDDLLLYHPTGGAPPAMNETNTNSPLFPHSLLPTPYSLLPTSVFLESYNKINK
ncbi:MAG: hypothetical protein DSM106950_16555 [Stigonema ocellatum SAG 48.90 = DSM 106950]|nr:hypothetical protein [Stigonema ocellatum SAG 48.90 = DSM 106950]